jgi:hypothetical protein
MSEPFFDIAVFSHWQSNAPLRERVTFSEFASRILRRAHVEFKPPAGLSSSDAKKQTPAVSPTMYPEGATRGKNNVTHVSMLGLDYDGITDAEMELVEKDLEGLQCAIYTSFNHSARRRHRHKLEDIAALLDIDSAKHDYTSLEAEILTAAKRIYRLQTNASLDDVKKALAEAEPLRRVHRAGCWSIRVFVPLSEPVPGTEWTSFWCRLQGALKVQSDTSCKDAGRIYGLPYCRPEDMAEARIVVQDGVPLNVAAVRALPGLELAVAEVSGPKSTRIDPQLVKDFAKRLSRSRNPKRKQVGMYMSDVVRGQPWSDVQGTRHEVMLPITQALEEEFPFASAEAIVDVLSPSMHVMAANDSSYDIAKRTEDAVRATEEAREKRIKRKAELEAKIDAERKKRIHDARGDGQDTAYSDADLERLAEIAHCTVDELGNKWIITKADTYYVLSLDGYDGPHKSETAARLAAQELLAPADIDVWMVNNRGERVLRSFTHTLHTYGSTFRGEVFPDINATCNYVDHLGRLHIRCCKRIAVEPREDATIAEYLKILGGESHDKLLDWLATFTDFSRPTSALFIHGVKDTGKSLFPKLLASLFGCGAVPLSSAMDVFNSALLSCPVVNADEAWPRVQGRDPSSEQIRNFISAHSRSLRRKGIPETEQLGCIRLLCGANSLKMLEFPSETLTDADRDAINQRFLILNPGEDVAKWMRGTSDEEKISWIDDGRFAAHVAWLAQTRSVKRGSKLLVEGNAENFADQIVDDDLLDVVLSGLSVREKQPTWLHRDDKDKKVSLSLKSLVLHVPSYSERKLRAQLSPWLTGEVVRPKTQGPAGTNHGRFWVLDMDKVAATALVKKCDLPYVPPPLAVVPSEGAA